MKADYHKLLGKPVTMTAMDAAWHLQCAVCESVSCTGNGGHPGKNIFGRPVSFSASADLAFSLGFASTGLRAGTILNSDEIAVNTETLAQAVRTHVPLVLFAITGSAYQTEQLARSGAVLFSAASAREATDLLLLSYNIAEKSLLPVVVCLDAASGITEETFDFPSKEMLSRFAENTDHFISSPTPAQQIIFGNKRRRVPGWFNPDSPVSTGAKKGMADSALETPANEAYFYDHLDRIIQEAYSEYNQAAGTAYSDVELSDPKHREYLILASGVAGMETRKAATAFRSKHKDSVSAARLLRIHPFPAAAVSSALTGVKALTVLGQAAAGDRYSPLYKDITALPGSGKLKLYSGHYGKIPSEAALMAAITNMLPGGENKTTYWLDIEFTHAVSKYPKHLVLLQAIAREYPDLKNKSLAPASAVPGNGSISAPHVPLHIRKRREQGPAYARLSRFFDDTASFYLSDPAELTADPFQALPVMPAHSASFNNQTTGRKPIPLLSPAACTACGHCFIHCPHSAIHPVALSPENLLKGGIAAASANGNRITQLMPMLKNLARHMQEIILEHTGNIPETAMLLHTAFERTAGQMKLDSDKLETARTDMDAVCEALRHLPLSVTDIFYSAPEAAKKGSGELFSLAIDPNACTGCSVCAQACSDGALHMTEPAEAAIESLRAQFNAWEYLPDTPAGTITRLLEEGKYDPFAAILLNRQNNLALSGGGSEDEATRSAVRQVMAVAEATVQPKVTAAINTLEELTGALLQNIHKQFSAALPSQDLDALAGVLSEIKEDRKPFDEVIGKFGSAEHLPAIDTKALKRKVELAKSLRMLQELLSEGISGTGRSRMGIALDDTLSWGRTWPWNNFSSPVFVTKGNSGLALARGLVEGHARQVTDNIKMIRRAELEINGQYEPDIHDIQIASLTWSDLTEQERDLVPPVLLIANRESMSGQGYGKLTGLLDSGWPVKVIILDDAAPEPATACASITDGLGTLLPALALDKVPVIKSSVAAPEHLFAGLTSLFSKNRPGLAWIFAPSVSKHWTHPAAFPKLHALSLDARAFPVFDLDTGQDGTLLSSRINIDANPQHDAPWMESELRYTRNGEQDTIHYTLTWADWAYTLVSWKDKFLPYTESMGEPVLVSEYLSLPAERRSGKCPVICRTDAHQELKRYRVPEEAVDATRACARSWALLRELSGELTDFPEKLEEKTEARLTEKYEQQLTETKQAYEQQIAQLEQENLERIRLRLKEKLLALSAYAKQP